MILNARHRFLERSPPCLPHRYRWWDIKCGSIRLSTTHTSAAKPTRLASLLLFVSRQQVPQARSTLKWRRDVQWRLDDNDCSEPLDGFWRPTGAREKRSSLLRTPNLFEHAAMRSRNKIRNWRRDSKEELLYYGGEWERSREKKRILNFQREKRIFRW